MFHKLSMSVGGVLRYCNIFININKTENENGCDAVY